MYNLQAKSDQTLTRCKYSPSHPERVLKGGGWWTRSRGSITEQNHERIGNHTNSIALFASPSCQFVG